MTTSEIFKAFIIDNGNDGGTISPIAPEIEKKGYTPPKPAPAQVPESPEKVPSEQSGTEERR